MKNKSIIFFDIDGTLVDEKTHLIPESTLSALNKAKSNGHLIFINTGRPLGILSELHKSLNWDGLILGCGTYIEYNNKILLHQSLGKELTKQLAHDIAEHKLEGALEGRYGVYFDNHNNIKTSGILNAIEALTFEGVYKGTTWYEDNIDVDKLVVFVRDDSDFNGFYKKYNDIFEFIKRDKTFYELVPHGYSKASGIEYIINHLNIPHKNTFAIGDSTNDLSMLEYVNNSIAMGNSNPLLFDKVNFVTKNVDDNGIYHALEHYGII